MKKIVAILMAMILVILVMVAIAGSAPAKETQTNYKKVIIGFEGKPNEADEKMIRDCGGETRYTYHIINAKAVEIPEQAIDRFKKNPRVKYVEEDAEVHTLQETLPWGVNRIDADLVWNSNKGTGVNISIIDTGIDYTHPDLKDNYKGGYDFVNNDADPKDDNGHGTHCAGIAAAENNTIGVVGVAPKANLYAVKVLDSRGSGSLSDCIEGIQWSVDNGMQVISMSWGSSAYSESLENASDAANAAGLVLVAAAGNSGDGNPDTNEYSYPAAYGSVIAVGATDKTDVAPSWSNSGPYLELAAPGVSIYSTLPTYSVTLTRTYGYNYGTLSGTSMACPHVAGTAALVIASDLTLTNVAVRSRLQTTADDLGPAGWDPVYGFGLVDAENATYIPTPDTTPPASITNLNESAVGETWINWTWTNPPDLDFSHVMVYLNSSFKENVSMNYYKATGIDSDTIYEIATRTVDTSGNINQTWVNDTAKTLPPDVTPPIISKVAATAITSSSANITWNTDEPADGLVKYGTTSGNYINSLSDPAYVTSHAIDLTGLAANTTYYYVVNSTDQSGNSNESSEYSFTTLEAPANLMHVASMDMWYTRVGRNYNIYTKVKIVNSSNATVEAATVYLNTTLPTGSNVSLSGDTTDGTVTFRYGPTRLTGNYTSTVTNVTKIDWTYNPVANVETSEKLKVS